MGKDSPPKAYLRELASKFPKHGALTLAKLAYRERPESWPSLEACRSMARAIFGVHGKKMRQETADKALFRKPRKAGWSDVIPESLNSVEEWKAVEIEGPARALSLMDIHIPWHNKMALELSLQYGKDNRADLILLNGDIVDHYALSDFQKDPKKRDFPAEVRAAKHFLGGLRNRFPHAQIVYKLGNHEERWERYLRLKAPDLLGLPDFEWGSVMGLDDYNIQLVDNKRPVHLGKLNVIHGHEYPNTISSPVNPARGLYLRAKVNAMCGHYHQTAQHSEKDLSGQVVSTWSVGCLCDLNPEYMPLNKWNLGFAFVEIDKRGAFEVENLRIIDGRIYR